MKLTSIETARRASAWVLLLAAGAACSGSPTSGFDLGDGGAHGFGAGGNGSGSGVIILGGSGSGSGVGGSDDADCPASAKLVYVTGEGSKLYSFYPPTFTFTEIGVLSCLGPEYTPTHMTVDRTGTAWVAAWVVDQNSALFETSSLYTASTANAACTKVANWIPQPGGNFSDFALTFIGTTSSNDSTLYLLGGTSGTLGSFETTTGTLTTIGTPAVSSPGGDMTTNGDGTLYYLQDTTELDLYEINPTNAQLLKSYSPSAMGGGDQALAFYGGSFYAFEDNVVYQFDPSTQKTTMLGKAPLQVTGAGQSTCVPTVPPTSK